MKMTKALAALLLSTALAGSFAGQSFAADIDHPECVAPAKPGGGFDLTCRVAQQGLMDTFGKPLQVTFMPGGIGAVAINQFNTTRTDDQNAIVAFSSGSLLNMAVGKYGEWTEKDVRFLATAGADFGAAVVPGDSKFPDLKSLMDAIKADPQSVIIGAGGSVGSQDWMKAALLFKAVAGLLGGAIQLYMGDVGEMVSHMGTNAMRILAVMSSDRLDPPFQDIPTTKELGYPDAEWTILRGFYMGKNVSDEAYDAWVAAFEKAYADPAFATLQKEKGLMPLNMAGPELVESIKTRVEKMRGIAKEAGLIQ
jgi:putative tricarboxylic transport membrane protein